jgi:thymidylate synthase (FAD)
MKLVNQDYKIIGTSKSVENAWTIIEAATRTCYQSERKDTSETPEEWCRRILLRNDNPEANHGAMLEHGTIYLEVPNFLVKQYLADSCWNILLHNPYTRAVNDDKNCYITTNLRVLYENNIEYVLDYAVYPSSLHIKRYTVCIDTSLQVYKELTRHRVFSFAIESTRYCNYSTNKFSNSIKYIEPCWAIEEEIPEIYKDFETLEDIYFKWIDKGWKPQEAATFIPQGIKAQMWMTGFVDDWEHLFKLRTRIALTGKPHPQMLEIMNPIYEDFVKLGYIERLE